MTPLLAAAWADLGIPLDLLSRRPLQLFEEASELVNVAIASDGRVWQLTPNAAAAWLAMQAAAQADGVDIQIASAYRASSRQCELIQRKLSQGQDIEQILQVLAPPGCSEHHTGRAVDIYQPGGPVVEEAFEATPAFTWLNLNATHFGFSLSFPRGNPSGYLYEPWHWCWHHM
ncbi:M15 family metallopeptidase [Janthinobacterium sp. B9-8]|uniref:M15 family metallopeptidase n=1 Tax=Janthinobacterium sp. B9-8 TaxID=1236179 RepID=UPI00061CE867|nr:M15 family metallopeptidase [Janthinobacterium sp. B9-8]AMC36316.1 D-alanyl-D-alanine carboxypeptidase [Janthinobacterium sp. B9-8]